MAVVTIWVEMRHGRAGGRLSSNIEVVDVVDMELEAGDDCFSLMYQQDPIDPLVLR